MQFAVGSFQCETFLCSATLKAFGGNLNHREATLASTLLLAYQEGYCVPALCALTGLTEAVVVTSLCSASRHLALSNEVLVDPERALGVQWEYVFCDA